MSDNAGLAFTAAQESCKQILALSTGVVAITVAFVKDLKEVSPSGLSLDPPFV
jgi:hypothetical protein